VSVTAQLVTGHDRWICVCVRRKRDRGRWISPGEVVTILRSVKVQIWRFDRSPEHGPIGRCDSGPEV
jgi:hypothetical protein